MKTKNMTQKLNLERAEQLLRTAQSLLREAGEPALSLVVGGVVQKVAIDLDHTPLPR